jgi:hypothetical protein
LNGNSGTSGFVQCKILKFSSKKLKAKRCKRDVKAYRTERLEIKGLNIAREFPPGSDLLTF